MTSPGQDRVRAITGVVRGSVQGVGFRYNTQRMAQQLRLVGWVRNESDGSVRVWVQGPAAPLARFSSFLERGPRGAFVSAVEVEGVEPDPTLHRFDIRF